MFELKKKIKEYGLTEKEARMYLSALTLGDSSMTELAKRSQIKRSSAYVIYKKLEEMGLMAQFKMRSGMRFLAKKPIIFETIAQNNLEIARELAPTLNAMYGEKYSKPRITYFEGKEAYLSAMLDSLKVPGSTIYTIGSLAKGYEIVTSEFDKHTFIPKRLKQNISIKAIYSHDTPKEIAGLPHEKELRELKILPAGFLLNSMKVIYGNTVVVASSKKDLSVVVIESEEIAQDEITNFNLLWKLLP